MQQFERECNELDRFFFLLKSKKSQETNKAGGRSAQDIPVAKQGLSRAEKPQG